MTTITKRVADTGIAKDELWLEDAEDAILLEGDAQTGSDVLILTTTSKFYSSIITKRVADTGLNRLEL